MLRAKLAEFHMVITSWWVYFLIIAPSIVFMGILYVIGEPFIYETMTDPITSLNGEIWTGFGSNLGVFIWACSAAIAIFSGLSLIYSTGLKQESYFLIIFGLLTLVLSLDDLFLFHDLVLPHFGISEYVIYVFYALTGFYILFKYLKLISQNENLLFYIGGTLFCFSIVIDVLPASPLLGFFEDAVKFVGIFAWSGYLARTSFIFINKALRNVHEIT